MSQILEFLRYFIFATGLGDWGTTVELQWLQHWWLMHHSYFKLVLESLTKNSIPADITVSAINFGWFPFYIDMVCCVYSLELPRWGDSNENTQHTFMLEKLKEISLLCLLSLRYDRTSPASNIFSWFHRWSSHWSLTVVSNICSSLDLEKGIKVTKIKTSVCLAKYMYTFYASCAIGRAPDL